MTEAERLAGFGGKPQEETEKDATMIPWPPISGAYYSDEAVALYCGDNRELLPVLPSVDLVLTDPPYGNGTSYISYTDTQEALADLIATAIPLAISKAPTALITCGVGNMWFYPKPTWVLCWATTAGVGSGPWGFCCWQPILAYGADPYLKRGLGRRADAIVLNEISAPSEHPCPKPIVLWHKLLLRGSPASGEIVLDPFCGSGTTLRAAKDLGRRAVGIEIEERYCEIAAKRCSQGVFPLDDPTKRIISQTGSLKGSREMGTL